MGKDDAEFCVHCASTKKERANFDKWRSSEHFRTVLQNMFGIPPERIIFCSLHAKIRVTSKLLRLLAQTASNNNSERQFIAAVRRSGWHNFDTWIPKGSTKIKVTGNFTSCDLELLSTLCLGITGTKCDKVLENIEQILPTVTMESNVVRLWTEWKWICSILEQTSVVDPNILSELETRIKEWGELYLLRYCDFNVTPYIHMVVCHTVPLLSMHGSIGRYSQQGFEATHKLHKRIYFSSTSHNGHVSQRKTPINSIEQLFCKIFRTQILYLYNQPNFRQEVVQLFW